MTFLNFLIFYKDYKKYINDDHMFYSCGEYLYIVKINDLSLVEPINNVNDVINFTYAQYSVLGECKLIVGLNKINFNKNVTNHNYIYVNHYYKSIEVAYYEELIEYNKLYTGLYKQWNSNGCLELIGNYFNGNFNGLWKYFKNNLLTHTETYIDGIPNAEWCYYQNNKVIYKYIFSENDRNKTILKLYENLNENNFITIEYYLSWIKQNNYLKLCEEKINKIFGINIKLIYYCSHNKYFIMVVMSDNKKINNNNKKISYYLEDYTIVFFINKFNSEEIFGIKNVNSNIDTTKSKKFYAKLEEAFYEDLDEKINYCKMTGPYKEWNDDGLLIIDIK